MPAKAAAGFRLSPQQAELYASQVSTGAIDSAQMTIGIEGTVSPDQLQNILHSMVGRYEILRTAFVRKRGLRLPLAIIQKDPVVFWRAMRVGTVDEEERVRQDEQSLAVPIEAGPSLRACLISSQSGTRLCLTIPAMQADAGSLLILFEDIANAYCLGTMSSTQPLQYVDYSEWLHSKMENGPRSEHQAGIEKDQGEKVRLPLESPPSGEPARTSFVERVLSFDVVRRMRSVEDEHLRSSSALLFACWQAFLMRLTHQEHIETGYWFDGRTIPETARAVGPFSRSIPLEVSADLRDSMLSLTERMETIRQTSRKRMSEATTYAACDPGSVDFEQLEWSSAVQGPGALMSLENLRLYLGTAKLKLYAVNRDERPEVHLQYQSNRYSPAFIRNLCGAFEVFCDAFARAPHSPCARIPVVGTAERERLLAVSRGMSETFGPQEVFHEQFDQQAGLFPERTAIICGNEKISYGELKSQSDQWAGALIRAGLRSGRPVALLLERSVEVAVAMLAVMKAGGAYAPIPPDQPATRLQSQLEALRPDLVVLDRSLAHGWQLNFKVVCLDEMAQPSEGLRSRRDETSLPDQLAYVISTTGSTGTPKWVGVTHRNLLNYVDSLCRNLDLEHIGGDRQLHFASVSSVATDLGNTCLFPAWATGGCVHLVPHEISVDAALFSQYNERHAIDILKIVPSQWIALASGTVQGKIFPAKWLIWGGETLPASALAHARSHGAACKFLNHYGPTETTVGCLTFPIDSTQVDSPPLGYPIANTCAYVLDEDGQLSPTGTVGELYVGGECVSRGYINDPTRTAERFLPDPFSAVPGARLYRTGDFVRRRADDAIEFIGRRDHQLKIRGMRVELGEIEAALNSLHGVKTSVVNARQDERGEKLLIAYVVADENAKISTEEVREALEKRLPLSIIPSHILFLERLPLNMSGKIDRAALPAPDWSRSERPQSMSPVEEVVAGAMADLLGAPTVGLDDNFFHRGGHSLLGTQLVARLRESLRNGITLRDLFQFPTPRTLADAIRRSTDRVEEILPRSVPRLPKMPLSYAQERIWFFEQLEPGNPSYIVPAAVWIEGTLNISFLEASINAVIQRQEILRTTFGSDEGKPYQTVLPPAPFTIRIVQIEDLEPGDRVSHAYRLAREESRAAFNLSELPLLRVTLFQTGPKSYLLVLAMHHILCDGWSIGILVREVTEHYRALAAGTPAHIPALPLQYVDFALWQRQWIQTEQAQQQRDYWRKTLEGATPLAFPVDYPRPLHLTFEGASLKFEFPADLSATIIRYSRQEGATVFMTLMAGFQSLLYRYTGQEDFVVGAGISNRPLRELEGLIGFFVNSLGIRASLSGNPSFRQVVKMARESMLDAYSNQDLPFEQLVAHLNLKRSSGSNPLFQVLFHMQNFQRDALQLPSAVLTPVWMDVGSVNFDFTLSMAQNGDSLSGTLDFNVNLFRQSTMAGFLNKFQQLMESAMRNPESDVLALSLIGPNQDNIQRDGNRKTLGSEQFTFAAGTS